jgi:hypothetical protein
MIFGRDFGCGFEGSFESDGSTPKRCRYFSLSGLKLTIRVSNGNSFAVAVGTLFPVWPWARISARS